MFKTEEEKQSELKELMERGLHSGVLSPEEIIRRVLFDDNPDRKELLIAAQTALLLQQTDIVVHLLGEINERLEVIYLCLDSQQSLSQKPWNFSRLGMTVRIAMRTVLGTIHTSSNQTNQTTSSTLSTNPVKESSAPALPG